MLCYYSHLGNDIQKSAHSNRHLPVRACWRRTKCYPGASLTRDDCSCIPWQPHALCSYSSKAINLLPHIFLNKEKFSAIFPPIHCPSGGRLALCTSKRREGGRGGGAEGGGGSSNSAWKWQILMKEMKRQFYSIYVRTWNIESVNILLLFKFMDRRWGNSRYFSGWYKA